MNLLKVKKIETTFVPIKSLKKEKTMGKTFLNFLKKNKLFWSKTKHFLWILIFIGTSHAYATGSTKKYVNSRANVDLSLKGICDKALDFLQSFWFGENVGYLLIFSFACVLTGVLLLFAQNPQRKKRGVWLLVGCAAIGAVWGITYKISGITLQG
ncbi:MAG: hypothetical protein KDK71_00960 [Chlamydiia bacterium]|nr:hypothetical protein [Chlamydiia bacterium]